MNVACFCGCCFSFAGDLCACPACGEYVTVSGVSGLEEDEMRAEVELLLIHHAAGSDPEPSCPPNSAEHAPSFAAPSQPADTA
jgi:hypothetical protein